MFLSVQCLLEGGKEALTISPESVEQIKKHMALSLQRMQELEEQIKVIPMMQVRWRTVLSGVCIKLISSNDL